MKRIIAGMIGAAMLGGAVVAQEVTFYNRMGSVLVEQDAAKDADANFGKLYDRIVGQYDSEKFSFFGRFQAEIVGSPTAAARQAIPAGVWGEFEKPWSDYIGLNASIIEFNGAMRPLPFLEIALGNSYGEELPWEGYELPGSYGYGSDVTYGRGEWADGNGGTVLFKGAGIGMDGLYIGWNILPVSNAIGFKGPDGFPDGWDTQVGVIYNVDGMLGIGVGARLSTRKWEEANGKDRNANQQIGVYLEYTGVENLKVGAGVTMDTNGTGGFFKNRKLDDTGFVKGGGVVGDALDWVGNVDEIDHGFNAFVNAGAEYNFGGMGLPLTLGADVGLYAGKTTVEVVQNGDDITAMPMLVGLLLRVDPMENLWFDLRGVYEDALVSEEDSNVSRLTITPRVHFLLSESDEFRLQVPITTNWIPNGVDGRDSYTGFNIEIFWQHNF